MVAGFPRSGNTGGSTHRNAAHILGQINRAAIFGSRLIERVELRGFRKPTDARGSWVSRILRILCCASLEAIDLLRAVVQSRSIPQSVKGMPRIGLLAISGLAVFSAVTSFAANSSRSPDGAGIPELTELFQTIDASTAGQTPFVSTLASAACSGFSAVQGPDLVYTWLAQTDNPSLPLHLDFHVTPQPGFDPVVYALSELDDGATCVAAIDTGGPGAPEMLHVEEQLVPGHRYYLYIDSRNSAASAGDFRLLVSTFISVELQSFTID